MDKLRVVRPVAVAACHDRTAVRCVFVGEAGYGSFAVQRVWVLLQRYRALLRRNTTLLQRVGALCRNVGLFGRDVGLFCGDMGLICGDMVFFFKLY